jgi:spectinomycin phosphotransferase
MQDEPADLSAPQIVETLRHHWRIETHAIEYAPVGFGSYHWGLVDRDGQRWFVTADRLSNLLGFGLDAEGNEAGLLAAYETAAALRHAGLDFVVAPIATFDGELLAYPAPDWALALFPIIDGDGGDFGTWRSVDEQTMAASLIGELHTVPALSITQRWNGAVPNRIHLEAALAMLDVPWTTGPYAEPTRHALSDARTRVETQLARYDRLLRRVISMREPWVTTHGEPHNANFIKSQDGSLHLIDWGTARLAPRERDLWIVLHREAAALNAYRATAGDYMPRPEALALFELLWQLADLGVYVRRFREPHASSADDSKSFRDLEATLAWLASLPGT